MAVLYVHEVAALRRSIHSVLRSLQEIFSKKKVTRAGFEPQMTTQHSPMYFFLLCLINVFTHMQRLHSVLSLIIRFKFDHTF